MKVKHAKKSLSIASPLLLDNDLDNAQDEYLLVASHIARALLLQSKIFPLSRPELPEQLKLIGQNDLSKIIEGLIYGIETHEELITLSKTIDMILSNIQLEADDSGQSEYLNTAVPAISS
ncbi:MAG: hypothetical protein HQK97_12645 [Nitrospirae bacterium]|nr:hypothetical protein [Nitrospirota bacterium]